MAMDGPMAKVRWLKSQLLRVCVVSKVLLEMGKNLVPAAPLVWSQMK
jgi:hypothetical protein